MKKGVIQELKRLEKELREILPENLWGEETRRKILDKCELKRRKKRVERNFDEKKIKNTSAVYKENFLIEEKKALVSVIKNSRETRGLKIYAVTLVLFQDEKLTEKNKVLNKARRKLKPLKDQDFKFLFCIEPGFREEGELECNRISGAGEWQISLHGIVWAKDEGFKKHIKSDFKRGLWSKKLKKEKDLYRWTKYSFKNSLVGKKDYKTCSIKEKRKVELLDFLKDFSPRELTQKNRVD